MDRNFITGAVLLVVGGLIIASAITGTTGSIFAVFLSPSGLTIKNSVAGTFRSAVGTGAASPTEAAASPSTQTAPTSPAQLPSAGLF